MRSPRAILNARRKWYSQAGEEGVIDAALAAISRRAPLARYFVEFGAWDGRHLSNTWFLAERGYAGCMIEGDALRYEELARNLAAHPSVRPLRRWIRPEGPDALDQVLEEVRAPRDFDVLSIDIDGDDYWVWKSLVRFRPRLVVIEVNARDKPGASRIHERGAPFRLGVSGTSITSMRELADAKGYRLLANVGCNALFVDAPYFPLLCGRPISEREAFTYEGLRLRDLTLAERVRKVAEWARSRRLRVR
jgi:hypothetical protein